MAFSKIAMNIISHYGHKNFGAESIRLKSYSIYAP
jgi:hypothetical protein